MPTYIPLSNTPLQFVDSSGDPLNAGTLEFYLSGTTTPTNLFSDSSGTSIGTTIALNSSGYPESGGNVITLFRDTSIDYKIIAKTSAAVPIWTADTLTFGLVIGTDVQAWDTHLQDIADIAAPTGADQMLASTGAGTYALESGATLRGSIGCDDAANITTGTLALARGGTGATTKVAAQEALGIYSGYVDSAATGEDLPSGWSATTSVTGNFVVTHNLGLADVDKFNVTATQNPGYAGQTNISAKAANSFTVQCRSTTGTLQDANFDFICIDRN